MADRVVIHTDGSCRNNGGSQPSARIGVFWDHDHPNNVSEKLEGRQTNNRAEIHAACKALEQAKEQGYQKVEIRTDSKLLTQGATSWMDGWKQNGWMNSNNEPVKNTEDFKRLDSFMDGMDVKWTHVRGHGNDEGNNAADRLARGVARK